MPDISTMINRFPAAIRLRGTAAWRLIAYYGPLEIAGTILLLSFGWVAHIWTDNGAALAYARTLENSSVSMAMPSSA